MERIYKSRLHAVAETSIKKLAEEAGAVVNPVVDDQNGWDHCVEFPAIENHPLPDMRPAGLMFFLQVKSAGKSAQSCKLTISSALKLAKNPAACFIVLFSFGDDPDRPKIYFRHVWTELIEQILRASRSASTKGFAINKKLITVKFSPSDLSDDKTIFRMVEILDRLGRNYTAQKLSITNFVGFENSAGNGKFSFAADVTPKEIADFSLGIIDSLKISSFSFYGERFGISEPSPLVELESGFITITPTPVAISSLLFRHLGTGVSVSLPGEVFLPVLPQPTPELTKIRFRTDLFDIMSDPLGETEFLSKPPEGIVPFDIIQKTAVLYSWSGKGPIDLQIFMGSRTITRIRLSIKKNNETIFWESLSLCLNVLDNLVPLEKRPEKFGFSFETLNQKINEMLGFKEIIEGPELEISFKISDAKEVPLATHFRCPFHLDMGSNVFLAIIERPIINVNRKSDQFVLSLGPSNVLNGTVFSGTAEGNRDAIAAEMRILPHAPGVWTMIPEV